MGYNGLSKKLNAQNQKHVIFFLLVTLLLILFLLDDLGSYNSKVQPVGYTSHLLRDKIILPLQIGKVECAEACYRKAMFRLNSYLSESGYVYVRCFHTSVMASGM